MRAFLLAVAFALVCIVSITTPGPAHAITFTIAQNDTTTVPTASNGFNAPSFTLDSAWIDGPIVGSSSGAYLSPWDGTAYASVLAYTSVRYGTAIYNITGSSLSLFWGSPDSYNSLTFYTDTDAGGSSVVLTGGALGSPLGSGHHLVTIVTDVAFRSIGISSTSAAFEFANLATPLPAALPLFATGLGALAWLKRRRKQRGAALAV